MPNKTLTARVKFDTKTAEASLKRLSRQITNLQKAVDKVTNKSTSKLATHINKATTATNKLNAAVNRVATSTNRVATATQRVKDATLKAKDSANRLGGAYDNANRSANGLLSTIKRVAATYLGMQSIGLAIKTSDTITSAENRFNNLKGATPENTSEAMDKIYAAAQRSRSSYSGMLSDVSKTMTLAGDSFQDNIDNAIRFQEIMAKAYVVGGASATEASTSMYQLVQALGSGTLAGDELRSVREGAPIAYKEIEKFVQGVLDTELSLKDLASQGLITSDIVVAAIMNAEEEITSSFDNTQATFGQTWNNIKNTAIKAFEPVLQQLNDALNSSTGQAMIEGISNALVGLANIVSWIFSVFSSFFTWCSENWEWLKYVVVGVITVILSLFAMWAAKAIVTAITNIISFVAQYWALLLIVAAIMAILYVYELWRQGAISTVEAIIAVLFILATVALIVGIAMGAMWLIWVALAVAAIAVIIMYFSELCGYINVGIQAIVESWLWCGNIIFGVWEWIKAAFNNAIEGIVVGFKNSVSWIVNFAMGLWNSIKAIAENIGIAFSNAWIGAQNMFWGFIQACLEGIQFLEPAINAIAEVFGFDGFTLSGVIDNVKNKQQEYKSFVSVGDAWNSGYNTRDYVSGEYQDLGDAWSKGFNTYDVFQDGWASNAYDSGFAWGQGIEDTINQWGSQFQSEDNKNGIFSDIGNMLNLDGLLDPHDEKYGVNGGYDPSGADEDINKALEKLGNIDDNVGDIKGSMDLQDDDLEYLRKIAEMEWRNEFTTAEIKVDMSNYNTINGEQDLDGIVEHLADTLRSEMTNVAYGVHF